MQNVLVTGATGFLGGAVARDLHKRGVKVVATGRNAQAGEALQRDDIQFESCDLAFNEAAIDRLIAPCDAVVHCAALSAPWGSMMSFLLANQLATQNLIHACERSKVMKRLVHISSPSVLFDFKDQPNLTESTEWAREPANHYIATKRMAEEAALDSARSGQDVIILRPRALFGPGDTTLLPRVIRVAQRGSFPLLGAGDPLMDLTWIDDAVTAVRLALNAASEHLGKVYHITSGDPQPRSRVLGTMLEACGLPVRFRQVSLGRAMIAATALEWVSRTFTRERWEPPLTRYSVGALGYCQTLDISAARADLGYAPTADVIDRLRETGQLWRTSHAMKEANS